MPFQQLLNPQHSIPLVGVRNSFRSSVVTTGRRIDDEFLAHIWLSRHENVHFYGTHTVDIAAELVTPDANGYRPLRMIPVARHPILGIRWCSRPWRCPPLTGSAVG